MCVCVYIYIYIYMRIWNTLNSLVCFLFLKIGCSYIHIITPSLGGRGRGLYFTVSVTRGIIALFLVTIAAVLLLPKHLVLYVCMFCVRRTVCCFYGMITSVVDCRKSSRSYNVESRFAEQRRTCTSVCYRGLLLVTSIVEYIVFWLSDILVNTVKQHDAPIKKHNTCLAFALIHFITIYYHQHNYNTI